MLCNYGVSQCKRQSSYNFLSGKQNTMVRQGNGVKVSILWIHHRSVAV